MQSIKLETKRALLQSLNEFFDLVQDENFSSKVLPSLNTKWGVISLMAQGSGGTAVPALEEMIQKLEAKNAEIRLRAVAMAQNFSWFSHIAIDRLIEGFNVFYEIIMDDLLTLKEACISASMIYANNDKTVMRPSNNTLDIYQNVSLLASICSIRYGRDGDSYRESEVMRLSVCNAIDKVTSSHWQLCSVTSYHHQPSSIAYDSNKLLVDLARQTITCIAERFMVTASDNHQNRVFETAACFKQMVNIYITTSAKKISELKKHRIRTTEETTLQAPHTASQEENWLSRICNATIGLIAPSEPSYILSNASLYPAPNTATLDHFQRSY